MVGVITFRIFTKIIAQREYYLHKQIQTENVHLLNDGMGIVVNFMSVHIRPCLWDNSRK